MIPLPEDFKQNILSLYPKEAGYFFEAISKESYTSVRLNKAKHSVVFADEERVPWCAEGRILKERPSFIEDPLFHAGAYYVQESSSMFLTALVQAITSDKGDLIVLDLCAAPGGKSTTLLDSLSENSLLVTNEIIKSRVGVLQENLIRWGRSNVAVTNNDPKHFQKLGEMFDLIVVDAPCSGEGLWRRDNEAINEWSMEHVRLCESRQARILHDILPCLKPGGFIIYSTCTFNEFENENQVKMLREHYQLEPYFIQIPESWNVHTEDNFQFKFLPHKVKGEGLFVAVLQKPDAVNHAKKRLGTAKLNFAPKKVIPEIHSFLNDPTQFDYFLENDFVFAFPKDKMPVYEQLRDALYLKYAGICLGKLDKKMCLIPEHSLALSVHVNTQMERINLSLEEAQSYLRKGNLIPNIDWKMGWNLACYNGLSLGWIKVLPNRINNYFPSEYRILKDINYA